MSRLRERTSEHHAKAEGRDLQKRMVQGGLTRTEYGAWLGQMWLVHTALERAVEQARTLPDAAVLGAIKPEHYHSRHLGEDCQFFGVTEAQAMFATSLVIANIENAAARSAFEIFGMYYVLEGSMNGNAFIAKAVARSFGLSGGKGLAYLLPYGERQREIWSQFKIEADGTPASEDQIRAAEAGAMSLFDSIADMSDEIVRVIREAEARK